MQYLEWLKEYKKYFNYGIDEIVKYYTDPKEWVKGYLLSEYGSAHLETKDGKREIDYFLDNVEIYHTKKIIDFFGIHIGFRNVYTLDDNINEVRYILHRIENTYKLDWYKNYSSYLFINDKYLKMYKNAPIKNTSTNNNILTYYTYEYDSTRLVEYKNEMPKIIKRLK